MKKTMGTLTIILGIIACIMFFNAGSKLNETGTEMNRLTSQSGTSLAEAYYQSVGDMNKGLGTLCYAMWIGTLAISIGIGSSYKTKNSNQQDNTKQGI